jgi:hypothetical protein
LNHFTVSSTSGLSALPHLLPLGICATKAPILFKQFKTSFQFLSLRRLDLYRLKTRKRYPAATLWLSYAMNLMSKSLDFDV